MLTEIKLYGHLKEITGSSSFKAKVSNTAEAVRFLISNFPTLEQEMANQYYRVSVNNLDIDKTELHNPIGISEIKIIPVVAGSGRGFGKALLGAALVGLAFLIPATVPYAPLKFGGGALFTGGTVFTKGLAYVGAALVLSGASDLFTPQVQPEAEDPLSASFSQAVNTTLATVPIPIVYGEYITGSVVISGSIETADGSPSTSGSQVVASGGNAVAIAVDEETDEAEEEYDRTNADTSLRRYVRVYSENYTSANQTFNRVKIEAVDGDNIYQGTGYSNNGQEFVDSYNDETTNRNQFNYNAFVRTGSGRNDVRYFPGTLRETIGTPIEEGRPAAGSDNGYYYGLVRGIPE